MLRAAVVVSAFLGGCVSNHTGRVEASYRADVDRIANLGLSKMVNGACHNASKRPGDVFTKPGQHIAVVSDRLRAKQRCGMIALELLDPPRVKVFIAQVCGGVDGAACANRYYEMFLARLTERYEFTDWNKILTRCKAYPVRCHQYTWVEQWAIEFHNDGVLAWTRKAVNDSRLQHAEAWERAYQREAAERRRIGRAIAAAGEAFKPPPTTTCTSTSFGTTTTTTCR